MSSMLKIKYIGEKIEGAVAIVDTKLIVIGSSLGGLQALAIIFSALPVDFSVPIALVHHRHSDLDHTLTAQIQRQFKKNSGLQVLEAEDKQLIEPKKVYLAPTGYHLLVDNENRFSLSTDAFVEMARPSIDVLFESAAEVYRDTVIGVILTGSNHDGAKGLVRIKKLGGLAIIQEPDSAHAPEMPRAAMERLKSDKMAGEVMPLEKIGSYLSRFCLAEENTRG
jgi:two-component system, chemotaxis family, protein-glutamate methylesterase/glutaminase